MNGCLYAIAMQHTHILRRRFCYHKSWFTIFVCRISTVIVISFSTLSNFAWIVLFVITIFVSFASWKLSTRLQCRSDKTIFCNVIKFCLESFVPDKVFCFSIFAVVQLPFHFLQMIQFIHLHESFEMCSDKSIDSPT